MNVVIVDWDIAYPPDSGKRLRTLNLMLGLAQRHRITYFSRGDGSSPQGREAAEFLRQRGVDAVFANIPVPQKRGWRFWTRLGASLVSETPYAVAAHRSLRFARQLRAYAARRHVDLWQVEWSAYVDMLRMPGAKTLLMAHNVDSLIWRRYAETEVRRAARWYIAGQRRRFEDYERRIFRRVTRVVAVSDVDAQLMRTEFGAQHVDVVDNGVDLSYFNFTTTRRDPRELLFLGSLDWRPNIDALQFMLDEVMPRLLVVEPAARLTAVGRNPSSRLSTLFAQLPHAELHANVRDVRPFLARAGMMIVPLRIAGGSRLKILEAAAAGLPVISTSVGAEGLKFRPGVDLSMADSAEDLTASIVRWIRSPEAACRCAASARQVVEENYSWARLSEQLEAVWQEVATPRAALLASSK